MASSLLHKSRKIYLSKEATNKDKSLKTQFLLPTGTRDEKVPILRKNGTKLTFWGDQVADFTIIKLNFSEDTLEYTNQGNITPVKGDLAVYFDYVILGQLIPVMNSPENIDEYEWLLNEVKMLIPLYNADSGELSGLEKRLAFTKVRGDQNEAFFSYGYDKSKSTKLCSTSKNPLPNIFSGTCFKKHQDILVEQGSMQEKSTLFLYLPSTSDRSHVIN